MLKTKFQKFKRLIKNVRKFKSFLEWYEPTEFVPSIVALKAVVDDQLKTKLHDKGQTDRDKRIIKQMDSLVYLLDMYIKNPYKASYYLKTEIFTILMGTSSREIRKQYAAYLDANNLKSLSADESDYVKNIILFDGTNVVNW